MPDPVNGVGAVMHRDDPTPSTSALPLPPPDDPENRARAIANALRRAEVAKVSIQSLSWPGTLVSSPNPSFIKEDALRIYTIASLALMAQMYFSEELAC